MPNKQAAVKALRQTKKHRLVNRHALNVLETAIKHAQKAITAKSSEAKAKVQAAIKALDKAAQKGYIKKNNSSRKKSRLLKTFHGMKK